MFQIRKYAEIAFDARADMQVSVAVRLPLRRGGFSHEKRDTARVSLGTSSAEGCSPQLSCIGSTDRQTLFQRRGGLLHVAPDRFSAEED